MPGLQWIGLGRKDLQINLILLWDKIFRDLCIDKYCLTIQTQLYFFLDKF